MNPGVSVNTSRILRKWLSSLPPGVEDQAFLKLQRSTGIEAYFVHRLVLDLGSKVMLHAQPAVDVRMLVYKKRDLRLSWQFLSIAMQHSSLV